MPPRFKVETSGPQFQVGTAGVRTRLVSFPLGGRIVSIRQPRGVRVEVRPLRIRLVSVGVQGPPGRPGANGTVGFEAENKGLVSAAAGMAAAVHSSGVGFVLANAAEPTAVGLCQTSAAPGFATVVLTGGPVTLADWSGALEGGGASLSPGGIYFLSAVSGKLTTTVPIAPGLLVQEMGTAVGPQTLMLEVSQPVRL